MGTYMSDIGNLYGTHKVGNKDVTIAKKGSNSDLDMLDFITLMIAQMSNQGIDDTMDTSEMLNQMVQMQMIQSMVNMTDATTMNYAATLVGKEVTVGKYVDGKLQEVYGEVTATGTMDGQPVIFVNDEYYYLSELMAVGKLPPPKEEEDDKEDDKTEGVDKPGKPDGEQKPDETQKPDGTQKPDETVPPSEETKDPEYNGADGAPNEG